MIRQEPAPGLDPGVVTSFAEKSGTSSGILRRKGYESGDGLDLKSSRFNRVARAPEHPRAQPTTRLTQVARDDRNRKGKSLRRTAT